MAFVERQAAARTDALGMRQPVLFEDEGFLPFEEIETVVARLRHQLAQLGRRQRATVDSGWTRMRNSTSFLMMLPTPAKISWSSRASHARVSGAARNFLSAAAADQSSDMTSPRQSYWLSRSPSIVLTEQV